MPKRKSFASRVKAASKRTSSRPSPQSPASSPQSESPATARLRSREIAADPEGTFVPTSTTPAAKPVRDAKAARLAKRAAATPTSNLQRPADASDLRPPATRRPQAEPDRGYVAVGRVLGPFGLKGELKVLPLTDNPDRFAPKAKLFAALDPVTVLRSREASGHLYLTLKGYPDRDSTDKFRHALLQVPESNLPPLPEGEFYRFQLIGLTVVDTTGAVLGTLDEIIETGSNDVYRVHPKEGADILLPALADVVVSTDLAERRMVVDPPDWR